MNTINMLKEIREELKHDTHKHFDNTNNKPVKHNHGFPVKGRISPSIKFVESTLSSRLKSAIKRKVMRQMSNSFMDELVDYSKGTLMHRFAILTRIRYNVNHTTSIYD